VLGELTREEETDSGLDLTGGEGVALVVATEVDGLGGDALEDVVDEGVHDGHTTLGDTGVRVNLLEHTVDVTGVGFDTLLLALISALLGALSGLLGGWLLALA